MGGEGDGRGIRFVRMKRGQFQKCEEICNFVRNTQTGASLPALTDVIHHPQKMPPCSRIQLSSRLSVIPRNGTVTFYFSELSHQ